MRKVVFGGANSLDNFIAREDGAVDWLLWGREAGELMRSFWKTIDTVVMGRKTYEASLALTPGGKNPYPEIRSYVFSRTLPAGERDGFEFVAEDAVDFTRRLKEGPGKDICLMGGGELGRSFLEAGVVDELGFNIHPVLLGRGVPLFRAMTRQIDLELLDCQRWENGCVYVSYRVKR